MPTVRTIAQALVICALSLNARLTIAQQPAGPANQCVPREGAPKEVFASLVPVGDSADAPAIYLGTLLQEVRLAFTGPDTIAKLSDGVMSVWLHSDGRLTNPRAADTLLPSEIIRTLTVAIDSVSRRGGIGGVFPQLRTDSVELRLIVHYADQRRPFSVPFLRVARPTVYLESQVEKPAVAKPGNPAPKYPFDLRASGISGEVLAQFVIDEAGRAEMRTFKILKASHEDFAKAVRDVLPRMRFFPAEIAGCKVRQIAELPFGFRTSP